MPAKNDDLHGNVPDTAPVALLLIDMINDLEFEGSEALAPAALRIATPIAELKRRAKQAGIPVIYCNDNWGKWQSDLNKLVEHCLTEDVRGRPMVELLKPDEDDYFVLKPKQSGFFGTTLDTLVNYLNVRTLIMTGVAGNICVLFTAQDAYMRDLDVIVPSDCIASNSAEANNAALEHLQQVIKADTTPSDQLDLDQIVQQASETNTASRS